MDQLERIKASRDNRKVKEILAKLAESAASKESTSKGSHPLNLLKLAVEAGRARATLGEISGGRHLTEGEGGASRGETCVSGG